MQCCKACGTRYDTSVSVVSQDPEGSEALRENRNKFGHNLKPHVLTHFLSKLRKANYMVFVFPVFMLVVFQVLQGFFSFANVFQPFVAIPTKMKTRRRTISPRVC